MVQCVNTSGCNSNFSKENVRLREEKITCTNIALFNARSLRNKMAQILHFLRANSIHVMAFTESWLGKSIGNNSIELPGFQAPFRRDRHENGGGVCLYISENLACKRREDLEQESIELIWVEVYLSPPKQNEITVLSLSAVATDRLAQLPYSMNTWKLSWTK